MSSVAPAIVMITRDRRAELLQTLERLSKLLASGEASEVIVVDNASRDGTDRAVRSRFPHVRLLSQSENLGAVGRNIGVRATTAPVVAFCDDDSWWEPGALGKAARAFAAHPALALVHARLVVEPGGETDRACLKMEAAPTRPGQPGPAIIGHLGCGTVVRREAYLDAGGYSAVLGFGGEEQLLSLDLAARGWQQCYLSGVRAHHHPSPDRESWPERWARYRRNDTLTALLRMPGTYAAGRALGLLGSAAGDRTLRRELIPFLRRLPAVARQRDPVPHEVWEQFVEFRLAD